MRSFSSALLSVVVAGGLLVVPTVAAPAADARPVPPQIQQLPLDGVDAASTTAERDRSLAATSTTRGEPGAAPAAPAPVVLTPELEVERFHALGVTWRGEAPEGIEIAVRVREAAGWSGWESLDLIEEGPDPGTAEATAARGGTTPLMTDGADAVQVRVDAPAGQRPEDLRLDLVDPGASAADQGAPQPVASADARSSLNVITRRQWGADESLRKGSPTVMSGAKALVIHHTAGSNTYSREGAYRELRSIYAYHTKTLGWADIGYNLVVDRFGRIFEGRAGSLTKPVQGAHASGFNSLTQGISVMGQFEPGAPKAPAYAPVSGEAVGAVADAVAWLSARYGINPTAGTSLTSAGGGTSRHAAGKVVNLPTVFGHRATSYTSCPGRSLNDQLGTIRSRASSQLAVGLAAPSVNATVHPYGQGVLSFTSTVPTVQRFTVTATSACSGAPVRTWTGTSSGGRLSWAWNLLDGSRYRPVPPGVYRISMVTTSGNGQTRSWSSDIEVVGGPGAPPSACGLTRLSGPDRFATSVQTGLRAFPTSSAVVLASGADASLVDGLVAGPFARSQSAPLLLTRPTGLPAAVVDDIRRRKPTTAWIVGSPAVVHPAVETQLRGLGVTTVRRLFGADRYGTASAVALAMGSPSGQAVLASGTSLVDAAAAGGAAAGTRTPVLLTAATGLPAVTGATLRTLGARTVRVVGSSAVVSEGVVSAVRGTGATNVTRLWGADRYATAAAVARAYDDVLGSDRVVVSSGADANIVDAMSASTLGRVTLLTHPTAATAATDSYLRSARPVEVYVAGSPGAVTTRVAGWLSGLTR